MYIKVIQLLSLDYSELLLHFINSVTQIDKRTGYLLVLVVNIVLTRYSFMQQILERGRLKKVVTY